jgi:HD-GYP domain-containing protein (c-di-GMP phosphodiesterase class II)
MAELIPGAWCHHENFDGSGYPRGLMGDNIPLLGRVVAIADTYDAMMTVRPYQQPLGRAAAIEILRKRADTFYDPLLVANFIRLLSVNFADVQTS